MTEHDLEVSLGFRITFLCERLTDVLSDLHNVLFELQFKHIQ